MNDISKHVNTHHNKSWRNTEQLGGGGLDGLALVNKIISGIADITVVNGIVYLPEFTRSQVSSVDLKKYL